MITFTFENGVTATIRTSGTEPKIKYYAEIASKPEDRYVIMLICTTRSCRIYFHELMQYGDLCIHLVPSADLLVNHWNSSPFRAHP